MSQPPPFPSENYHTRESVALFDDTGAQQYFAVDVYKAIGGYESEHWLNDGPYHTGLLREVIRLARRLVFSEVGKSVFDRTPVLERVATFEEFKKSPLMTLIVTNKIRRATEIWRGRGSCLPELRLKFDLVNSAAQAQYWAMVPDATNQARIKRDRHILYLAIFVAHAMEEIMNIKEIQQSDSGRMPMIGIGPSEDTSRIVKPGEWGWNLERRLLGGVMTGVAEPKVALSASELTALRAMLPPRGPRPGYELRNGLFQRILPTPESIADGSYIPYGFRPRKAVDNRPIELAGISVGLARNEVDGYFLIRDDIIRSIVEGEEGWEQHIPLNVGDHSQNGFIPGKHPDGFFREDEMARRERLYNQGPGRGCGTHRPRWEPLDIPLQSRLVEQYAAIAVTPDLSSG